MTILTLGTGGVAAMAVHPVGPAPDPAAEVAAQVRAATALQTLAARLREVATLVAVQADVHRRLLELDWHGSAAALFTDAVSTRAAALSSLVRTAEQLADEALRRTQQLAGGW